MINALGAAFRIFVLTLFLLVYSNAQSSAGGGLTKIADNVYAYVDVKNAEPSNSYGANAGIVIGKEGVLVVDTLISAKEAKRFIADIRTITDKPIKYVVNTHYHLDHTFGNGEFAKLGAVIIAHERDKKSFELHGAHVLKNIGNYGLSEADMAGTTLAYPKLTFSDRAEIDLGDERVELIAAGASHTDGSILVSVHNRKIVFAGDVLFTGYHPYMAEGDINGWVAALDMLGKMEATTIIPGHGPISNAKDLTEMKEYIVLFDREAKRFAMETGDVDDIYSRLKTLLPARSEGDWLIRANIRMRYVKK
ncbi:MAG TPA: MBL fold metallo-hydrolase [Dissulfurispiraceae bacterium]|nr:MBL fold metallo-hydrolase [Dissulfurispiraceae bacterium]